MRLSADGIELCSTVVGLMLNLDHNQFVFNTCIYTDIYMYIYIYVSFGMFQPCAVGDFAFGRITCNRNTQPFATEGSFEGNP